MTHTKGPWKAHKTNQARSGVPEFEIHWSDAGECVAEIVHGEADARLIAAAPEMLGIRNKWLKRIGGNMTRTQIWSSGGGMQSAAIAALIVLGEIRPDLAVIVDTEREQSTTWEYMDEVITPELAKVGFVLHRVKKSDFATVDLYGGADGETLLMPVFTDQSGDIGKLPTYCSNEWKTRVVRRWATAQGCTAADIWVGISSDEKHRMKASGAKWGYRHPLIERGMNRGNCQALVKRMGWPAPPRSSCWNCPNHTQEEWRDIKENKPADWSQAIRFDREIRRRDPHAFLHPDCIPLEDADLSDQNGVLFGHCDSGMCFV